MPSTASELLEKLTKLGIPESALELRMIRASGPGGQHVNKVSSAIQLNCHLTHCHLNETVKTRLKRIAGRRISTEQTLGLTAQQFRTQEQNKRDALERLLGMVEEARIVPKLRRATRPTKASQIRRLDTKQQRGQRKSVRRKITRHEDE